MYAYTVLYFSQLASQAGNMENITRSNWNVPVLKPTWVTLQWQHSKFLLASRVGPFWMKLGCLAQDLPTVGIRASATYSAVHSKHQRNSQTVLSAYETTQCKLHVCTNHKSSILQATSYFQLTRRHMILAILLIIEQSSFTGTHSGHKEKTNRLWSGMIWPELAFQLSYSINLSQFYLHIIYIPIQPIPDNTFSTWPIICCQNIQANICAHVCKSDIFYCMPVLQLLYGELPLTVCNLLARLLAKMKSITIIMFKRMQWKFNC